MSQPNILSAEVFDNAGAGGLSSVIGAKRPAGCSLIDFDRIKGSLPEGYFLILRKAEGSYFGGGSRLCSAAKILSLLALISLRSRCC